MIKNITGVILAGGKSSRFHSNKALANIEGKTMLEYIHGILSSFCTEVLVSGNCSEYKKLNLKTQADILPEIGPLGGIYSLLKTVDTPYLLFLTCDMPLINDELIKRLIEQGMKQKSNAVIFQIANNLQPFPLLIANTKENIEVIASNIIDKQYSIRRLLDSISYTGIDVNDETDKNTFFNINNQENYNTLKQLLNE